VIVESSGGAALRGGNVDTTAAIYFSVTLTLSGRKTWLAAASGDAGL